nr:hypothetical protein [Brevibacillus agri]
MKGLQESRPPSTLSPRSGQGAIAASGSFPLLPTWSSTKTVWLS